jgi:Family of unknown function (DUF6353)
VHHSRVLVDLDICKGDASKVNVEPLIQSVRRKSPLIFTSAAVIGVLTTAYLTGKATVKADKAVRLSDYNRHPGGPAEFPKDRRKRIFKLTWKYYIPPAISATLTTACIVTNTKVGHNRAAAAQAAFALTERAYTEYREKVVEEFGKDKDEKIRAEVARDHVRANPPMIMSGPGNVLCCEMFTGRYFTSDMESLRKAVNDLNARIIQQDSCSMDDFYYLVGLQRTQYSADVGWTADKMLELLFSTILTDDGRPCLAFEYNYHKPLYEGLFR